MNTKDIEDLFRLFKHMTMNQSENRDHYYNEQLRHENEYNIKFASWIKQTYPDVWEAWRALQDLENSTKTEIGIGTWHNR